MIRVDRHEASTGDGWILSLRRTADTDALVKGRNPLLIVPGYGMNSFIFSFHPGGQSMEAYLAQRGFEVWSVDLREQGHSRCEGGTSRYRFEDFVMKDLFAAVHAVIDTTATEASEVDILGCSLGATMMFAYVVCVEDHGVGRMVSMGGPLRWVKTSAWMKLVFYSPELVGMLPIIGTRRLAGLALPLLIKAPKLLSFYLHPEIVDLSHAAQLVRTVENPNRHVNRDVATWIKERDLIVDGKNVCEEIRKVKLPLLTVIANADGIVPRETALWPHLTIGSESREILEVGTDSIPIAHADMFVSRQAPEMVWSPLADWLCG